MSSSSSSSSLAQQEHDPLLVDDDVEEISLDSEYDSDTDDAVTLRIKATHPGHDSKDVTVTVVPSTDTVASLKQAVLEALGDDTDDSKSNTTTPYVRLVARGRLLAPDAAVLERLPFRLESNDVVHAIIQQKEPSNFRLGPQALLQQGGLPVRNRLWRGAGISADGVAVRETHVDEDDDEDSDVEAANERLGFDRLRELGLRRSQVSAVRSYFNRQVDAYVRQNPQTHASETDAVRRRLLQEDAWMQTQGPTSEFRLNLGSTMTNNNTLAWPTGSDTQLYRGSASVGTDRDFLWGFLLGFFVGFFMLVWVWMPTVPHKQKLGILTGITFQLALGMLQGGGVHDDEDADDSLVD